MKPRLYIFTISHFCEKARWALDHYSIDYDLVRLAPGPHALKIKNLGAKASSLPVLQLDNRLIQGSSAIVDWAIKYNRGGRPSLRVAASNETLAREMESRLDKRVGVHVRRMFYSEALVEFPQTVKPVFADGLTGMKRMLLNMSWPMVRQLMIKGMDLGYEQGLESQRVLGQQIEWLDGLLSDGRNYLVGDAFSRVDITAASLLARVAMAAEHPAGGHFVQPPRMQAKVKEWQQGPTLGWVAQVYKQHRWILP